MEPYRRLLIGFAKLEDSILVPTWASPFSALFPALRRRHFLIALISLVAILSEILPIALANTPFSAATTKEAYETCTFLAMAILILMLLSVVILIFRPSRGLYDLRGNQ
jgi:Protein of unknown function (DUF3433)